jgi:hypothetical protein
MASTATESPVEKYRLAVRPWPNIHVGADLVSLTIELVCVDASVKSYHIPFMMKVEESCFASKVRRF